MDYFYFGHMSDWGIGGYLGLCVLWVIGIILLIWLIKTAFLTRKSNNPATPTPEPEKSPLDILKERYAKGEITKKEYESKKKEFLT